MWSACCTVFGSIKPLHSIVHLVVFLSNLSKLILRLVDKKYHGSECRISGVGILGLLALRINRHPIPCEPFEYLTSKIHRELVWLYLPYYCPWNVH